MITFLKIVLAVFLVIALLILAAWLWFRHRFKRAIGDFSVANDLIGQLRLEPARIQLHRAEQSEYSKAVVHLRDQLRRLGFQRMADFADYDGAFQLLIAARHREYPVAAALIEDSYEQVSFVLFSMNQDRQVVARGNAPGTGFTSGNIDWRLDPEFSPNAALDDLSNYLSDTSLPFDLGLFRAVYEQVHAARMDQKIVHEPRRESLEKLAAELPEAATEEQIDTAHQIVIDHWKAQIAEAALDRYRRSSKIDAVAWEELRDEIQVVHARIDNDEIAALLVIDDISERIYDQCVAQGLGGIALYKAIAERLPPDQQWTQIGEVNRPVRALLFRPNQEIESDVPSARRYVYEAENDDGQTLHGGVYAENSADAKRQAANLGLHNPKLLVEPAVGTDDLDGFLNDASTAAIAARATREGVLKSMLRALLSNWWIWGPPAALLTKTVVDGSPYGWGDFAGLALAVLAVLALIFLIGPMFIHNQLMVAQLRAQPKRAKRWIRLLELMGRFVGVSRSQLTTEKCKALAEEGNLEGALRLRSEDRAELTEEEYQAALAQIYGTAGNWPAMIDAQRAFLEETPAKETATVDLALSLARYTDDVESVEPLLQSVAPADLPEVTLMGYQYVRGLVAAHRGQHRQALRHYAQSIETARQFESMPIMLGLIAEIKGYAALAFKHTGNLALAQSLWDQAWPIIKVHRSAERLIAAFESH